MSKYSQLDFSFSEHSDLIPTNSSFIVLDYHQEPALHSVSDDAIFAKITFLSEHLAHSGCAILVPPLHDLSRLNTLLEESQSTIKLQQSKRLNILLQHQLRNSNYSHSIILFEGK